jgi:hypothetical protein
MKSNFLLTGLLIDREHVIALIDPEMCINCGKSSARIYRPSFRENKPKTLVFSFIQNERFGLVFVKTGSIISGTNVIRKLFCRCYTLQEI